MNSEKKDEPCKSECPNFGKKAHVASCFLKHTIQIVFLLIGASAFGFGVGDRIESTTSDLNIRSGPGLTYGTITQANVSDLGVISNGPYSGSGYIWYNINWDKYPSGYSVTNYLQSIAPLAPVLISPGSTSSPGTVYTSSTLNYLWHTSTGATGYGIYVLDVDLGSLILNNDNIGNSTNIVGPLSFIPGHKYEWYVRASDSAGYSGYSSLLYFRYIPPPTSILVGYNSITATSAVFTASFYPNGSPAYAYFQYDTSTPPSYSLLGTNIISNLSGQWTLSSAINGLSPTTKYYFQLVVTNASGTYTSSIGSFTTPTAVPTMPSNLVVSNTASGISLTWQDNSSNESGFLIQRQQGITTKYFSVGENQANYTDTSVSPGVQYCYSVAATNSGGSSAYTPQQCDTYYPPGPKPIAIIAGYLTPVIGTTTYYGSYSTGIGLSYSWTTSNGQMSTVANPQFAFNSPGTYTIYLTVTDSSLQTSAASISINVQPSNAGNSIGVAVGADPVVLSTGNYIQNHVDLKMPGKGFPFEFRRFYNSKFSNQTGQPLGFGWTCNYNERLENTGTNVLVIQGDGSTWAFFPTNNGYVGEPGIFDTLVSNADNTWTLTDKNQTVTSFDTNGVLASITDKNGNTLTCAYVGGVLNQIEDTAGRIVSFTTNSYGCIAGMTDPLGRTVQYLYDANTNLVEVIDADLHTNFYNYDANHQMTNAIDGRGICYIQNVYDPTNFTVIRQADAFTNWTYLGYDFTNRITYVTNALGKVSIHQFDENLLETNVIDEAGNQQIFQYDNNRDRIYIRDKNGNETHYGYDSNGNVTNKIDALNDVTTIQYDSLNNPIRRVDALTNVTTFGYDPRGNLTSTTNALGLVSSVQYDINGLPIILTDARGGSTTNQYNAEGDLTNVIDATGAATRYAYDAVGRKIAQIDALNHSTSFTYDNDDNLLFTTNALGFVTAYTYDADNNRVTSTNPRNATTTNVFDLKDQLVATLAPLGQTNGIAYDALERKIATFDALGNETEYAYDDIGNVIAVTNALNQVTRFTYDPNGNQTSVIDPIGHYVTNFFDLLNRKVETIDIGISTNLTAYDALGRVVATTNAIGQVTQFFYDGIGRLTNVVDSADQPVSFAYDENGNHTRTTNLDGHTWTNVFDNLNRLIEQHNPDGTATYLHYDSVGNLTNKITPNGDNIFYSYDSLNRLKNITYPSGPPVTFAYDEVGNRTNMVDSAGTTTWRYDLLNRLVSVTDPFGQTVANGFDANGNRVSLTYPGDKVVNYGFDALNRMTVLTNWLNGVVTYAYDYRGNLIASTNANGTIVSYSYDVADRLIALTNTVPNASIIAAYSLTLDGLGNHKEETHDQPLFPILSNQADNYSYDADNRLLAVDSQAVTHNKNGDLTGIGTNTYAYDFEDRLVSLVNGSTNVAFTYDGLGSRLAHTVNGQSERFVLDRMGGLTQVLVEADTNNVPVAYYIYGNGLAERISADGTVVTYHFDIQGSTVALTDSGGNVSDSYAYDSFGVLANSNGDSPQPFRYLGRYGIVDDGTGLLYARARYWSPQLGRFFTKDVAASKDNDGQTLNRFVYALNNPLRFSDITGLVATEGNFAFASSSFPRFVIVPEQAEVLLPPRTANSTMAYVPGGSGINWVQVGNYTLMGIQVGAEAFFAGPETLVAAPEEFIAEEAGLAALEEGAENAPQIFYRGDQAGLTQFQSPAAQIGGLENSQEILANGDLNELMLNHAIDSTQPPSPFISITTDQAVAREFAGSQGNVYQIQLAPGRAIQNLLNPLPESEWLVPHSITPSEIQGTIP